MEFEQNERGYVASRVLKLKEDGTETPSSLITCYTLGTKSITLGDKKLIDLFIDWVARFFEYLS